MRTISYDLIVQTVKDMCIEANYDLPKEVYKAFSDSLQEESSPLGFSILEQCVLNADIATKERIPICQDTGLAVFFVEYGVNLQIEGGLIYDAINEGVKLGYTEGYLRKSSLKDPLYNRANTGDNTPAIIHLELQKGESLSITMAPKGGGAENMSRLMMFPPSAGEKGIIDFVQEAVEKAGGNPCPPTVIGVGIGGNFEKVTYLAKKALFWPLGKPNINPKYAELEQKILRAINNTGVGPQGLGGNVTSFFVHIEVAPCHIASMPVAVNINCHAHRHSHRVL